MNDCLKVCTRDPVPQASTSRCLSYQKLLMSAESHVPSSVAPLVPTEDVASLYEVTSP